MGCGASKNKTNDVILPISTGNEIEMTTVEPLYKSSTIVEEDEVEMVDINEEVICSSNDNDENKKNSTRSFHIPNEQVKLAWV